MQFSIWKYYYIYIKVNIFSNLKNQHFSEAQFKILKHFQRCPDMCCVGGNLRLKRSFWLFLHIQHFHLWLTSIYDVLLNAVVMYKLYFVNLVAYVWCMHIVPFHYLSHILSTFAFSLLFCNIILAIWHCYTVFHNDASLYEMHPFS